MGGYDASRFVPSNLSIPFAADISRDMVLGLQSISVGGLNTTKNKIDLLPEPIITFVDAGVSHIWLPESACAAFEKAFGLVWDARHELYILNSTQHDALTRQKSEICFKLGLDKTSEPSYSICLPYAAFDLELTTNYPGIEDTVHYFPLRRAANDTQYTLGRAFLQESYIIADYERKSFTLNQALFSRESSNIQTIEPVSRPQSSSPVSAGVIAGIAVGAALIIILAVATLFIVRRRRRTRLQAFSPADEPRGLHEADADAKPLRGVHEMPEIKKSTSELHSPLPVQELSGTRYYELELSPTRHELDAGWQGHEAKSPQKMSPSG